MLKAIVTHFDEIEPQQCPWIPTTSGSTEFKILI